MSQTKLIASISLVLLCVGGSLAAPEAAPPAQQPANESGSQSSGRGPSPNAQPATDSHGENAQQTPATQTPADPEDEIICKRDNSTGTRVARQKLCLTRREWRQVGSD